MNKILLDFLNNASADERREFMSLLEARRGKKTNPANAEDFAKKISRQIRSRVGFTEENVRKTAIDIVRRLARQHQPNITEAELDGLVAQMVPGARIPPDVLKSMVMNYALFMSGRMSAEESAGFPQGWQKRFWEAFPAEVKRAISDFLANKTEPEEFWRKIKRIIG
ncbi:MAG: hypothetical protein FWG13_05565 [Leptospirales bacterium]|nr:hypothetical protein [Leptospirales bacterium]